MRYLFCCTAEGQGVWRSCCYCHHVSSSFCSLLLKLFPWKWFSFFIFCSFFLILYSNIGIVRRRRRIIILILLAQSVAVANSAARTERNGRRKCDGYPDCRDRADESKCSKFVFFFSFSFSSLSLNTKWGEGGRVLFSSSLACFYCCFAVLRSARYNKLCLPARASSSSSSSSSRSIRFLSLCCHGTIVSLEYSTYDLRLTVGWFNVDDMSGVR